MKVTENFIKCFTTFNLCRLFIYDNINTSNFLPLTRAVVQRCNIVTTYESWVEIRCRVLYAFVMWTSLKIFILGKSDFTFPFPKEMNMTNAKTCPFDMEMSSYQKTTTVLNLFRDWHKLACYSSIKKQRGERCTYYIVHNFVLAPNILVY